MQHDWTADNHFVILKYKLRIVGICVTTFLLVCPFLPGVWNGLVPRIIMIGTLTALQWFIYDSVKVYFRLPRPPPPEMPESLKKKLGLTE